MSEDLTAQLVGLIELALLVLGAILLWRHVLSPATRQQRRFTPPGLAAWTISVPDFFLYSFVIVSGGFLASVAAGILFRYFSLTADDATVLGSTAFQLGLLASAGFAHVLLRREPLRVSFDRSMLASGLVTFLIALPIVTVTSLVWLQFLQLTGLPAEQQDLLRMFFEAESTALLAWMIVLATLIAPITEEVLFRATLFRYLRTRVPRWLALVVPGLLFAALHVNWMTGDGLASFAPLCVLAIVFSLAYERTGRIGTAIVAHAIFNLHTIAVLFTGVVPLQ